MTRVTAPTLDDIAAMARAELAALPAELRRHTEGVMVRVDEFADEETEVEMCLETPFDLLGLYRGVSLDQRGANDGGTQPNMIFLYRRPILDYWCDSGDDLRRVVRHVLIHEIGHHFGYSDNDMERLEKKR